MAATPSTMARLGSQMPDFSLADPAGVMHHRDDLVGDKGTLIMFICNHCPFVVLVREELARLGGWCLDQGVGVVAINANDVERYPADAPDKMALEKEQAGYPFEYLFDATQEVARAFGAACTPDFFLYDAEGKLVYRGQLDDARPGNGKAVTGADLLQAISALVAGEGICEDQNPSIGCNIKWKPGNEPK